MEDNDLSDEIRLGLGLGFQFTKAPDTCDGGTCETIRIDQIYNPNILGANWSSSIQEDVIKSDHAASP